MSRVVSGAMSQMAAQSSMAKQLPEKRLAISRWLLAQEKTSCQMSVSSDQ
jgi:hypothetical protein